ncbi:hypothetical protein HDA30_000236 [Micrococcus cohnii]|uniref:Uncharacterized protein n=1 Tax=Micrococcus cohnii TaxID=993416 RepID=A0A7W7GM93_9MICC|nr:hypothetical protein [Micrococcus cohnii]MBB4734728.1 hypothetical protein [Micrococcus cohnii]
MSRIVLPPHLKEHDCGLWFVLTRAPWWSYKAYTYLSKPEKPRDVRWLNRAKRWLVRIILCSPALMVVLLLLRGLPLTLPWLVFCVAPLVIYLFLPAVQYLRGQVPGSGVTVFEA